MKLARNFVLALALAFAAPFAASAANIQQTQAQQQLYKTQAQVNQLYGPGA